MTKPPMCDQLQPIELGNDSQGDDQLILGTEARSFFDFSLSELVNRLPLAHTNVRQRKLRRNIIEFS